MWCVSYTIVSAHRTLAVFKMSGWKKENGIGLEWISGLRSIMLLLLIIQGQITQLSTTSADEMSPVMRKPIMWFLTRFNTNLVAKTKALISFAVTAKLICTFVFAYAKC